MTRRGRPLSSFFPSLRATKPAIKELLHPLRAAQASGRRAVPVSPRRRLASLTMAISAGVVLSASPAGAGLPATADRIRNWAPNQEGSGSLTEAEAVADAQRFDVISALAGTYKDYVAAMKAANSDLVLLVYLNGTFAQSNQGSHYPESWYLRDMYGEKVRSKGWGNYLMNPARWGWLQDRVETCRSFLASSGYDGCWVDMLGTGPLYPGYLTNAPINPATGKVWTKSEWLAATSNLAAKIKAGVSPRFVVGNGLGSGPRYFDSSAPSKQILSGMDGGGAETWMRTAWQKLTSYPSETSWKLNVDMLADATAAGKSVLVITKAWASGTSAQKDAWHKFALASFLLGNFSTSYFYFSYSSTASPTTGHPWWSIDLGSAAAAYAKIDGVYQRTFANGKVLVNPTTSTYTISLGGTYKDLSGNTVTSVTLGPYGAEILTKA